MTNRFSALLAILAFSGAALPQNYTAVVLEKAPGHSYTLGTGAGDKHFAAIGNFPNTNYPYETRAVLFDKSGAYIDVTPSGFGGALINDSEGNKHGGGATPVQGYPAYAFYWEGATPVNLHPSGYSVSEVLGVGGGLQAGYVFFGFYCSECGRIVQRHAGVWSGTAASFRRLHSMLHEFTAATDTDGVQTVGRGSHVNSGYEHALLWPTTTSMAVDLHPPGPYERSFTSGVANGQQVGGIILDNGDLHAALWTGSASSFRDLNPPQFYLTDIYAVRNGVQVGTGNLWSETWKHRALAWQGTKASVIDLHALLPAEYQSWNSSAQDIDSAGNIVGFVNLTDQWRPVVWIRNSKTGSRR